MDPNKRLGRLMGKVEPAGEIWLVGGPGMFLHGSAGPRWVETFDGSRRWDRRESEGHEAFLSRCAKGAKAEKEAQTGIRQTVSWHIEAERNG